MSYTHEAAQPQGYPYLITNKIREALIAEIYAINGYASHIAHSNMTEINAAWHSIMKDEKEHYGLFLSLLRQHDPVQYQRYLEHRNEKYGPPERMQPYQPDFTQAHILNNIRDDIKGEFEAVILYEQQIEEISYPDIQAVYRTVISDEKWHVEHLTQLLLKYDPDPYGSLD